MKLLDPTGAHKQGLAPAHGNMEAVLTALTSLIHGGKNIFYSEAGHVLVYLDLQLPGLYSLNSEWKSTESRDRRGFIWLF